MFTALQCARYDPLDKIVASGIDLGMTSRDATSLADEIQRQLLLNVNNWHNKHNSFWQQQLFPPTNTAKH